MQQKFLSIQQLQDLYEKYSSKDIFDAFSSEFLQHLTDFQPLLKNQNDPWKKVDPYSLGYIDEAPLSPDSLNKKTRRPPDGYLCHLCFCKGHYIKDCPQVITVQVNCKIQNRSCPRAIVLFVWRCRQDQKAKDLHLIKGKNDVLANTNAQVASANG